MKRAVFTAGAAAILGAVVVSTDALAQLDRSHARALPSVVAIRAEGHPGAPGRADRTDEGAGVVLHGDGFIATAGHLVAQADGIEVRFSDGTRLPARLVTLSRTEDLALVKVDQLPRSATVATLADSDRVAVGQALFSVGVSEESPGLLQTGIVQAVREGKATAQSPLTPRRVLQVEPALNQGSFGGPVFNERGEVLGLATHLGALSSNGPRFGFVVPAALVRQRLFETALPYVGMNLRFVNAELASLMNWPVDGGLLVEWVKPGSAAENAGMRGGTVEATVGEVRMLLGGDLILQMGELDATRLDEIGRYLSTRRAGSVLRYTVLRGGKRVTAEVVVEDVVKVPALKASARK